MEENMQHFCYIMFYYFQKSKNRTEMQEEICAAYGESAVNDQMFQKWFGKFRAGDFLLYDAPLSGRPVEVDSDSNQDLN